uniref:Delta/kappa-conotoxin Mo3964 n=1 Tax=Conus monile TaxID=351660 RepID=CXRA_CONMO|nr:RecName: Full=Delta/kappa-conotoxin Mo3964; Short=Mo3964 [Conus monile]2MW7_A Chain A, Mo3964 [Conus monile]
DGECGDKDEPCCGRPDGAKVCNDPWVCILTSSRCENP